MDATTVTAITGLVVAVCAGAVAIVRAIRCEHLHTATTERVETHEKKCANDRASADNQIEELRQQIAAMARR